jgi:hypothetical protein
MLLTGFTLPLGIDMYCPNCGTENGDGSKFCRQCGSNISLVPQALSGTLADARQPQEDAAHQFAGKVESGVKKSLIGLGFVIIAMAMLLGRNHDWWLMLVPAAILLGKGVSQILTLRYLRYAGLLIPPRPAESSPTVAENQARQRLFDRSVPPSVTENTTRNMSQRSEERQ